MRVYGQDYSKIKHLKDLNNSMFNERMNKAYDYGYMDGLANGTEIGYKRGYANGQKSGKDIQNWNDVVTKAEEYQRGLDDLFNAIKTLLDMNHYVVYEIFGDEELVDILDEYRPQTIVDRINAYANADGCKTCGTCSKFGKQSSSIDDTLDDIGCEIEKLADKLNCTVEVIAEKANQIWENILDDKK